MEHCVTTPPYRSGTKLAEKYKYEKNRLVDDQTVFYNVLW
jgi:hypothetical protein